MKYEEIEFEVRRAVYYFASEGYMSLDFSDPDGEEFASSSRPLMPYQFFQMRIGEVHNLIKDLEFEEVRELLFKSINEFESTHNG